MGSYQKIKHHGHPQKDSSPFYLFGDHDVCFQYFQTSWVDGNMRLTSKALLLLNIIGGRLLLAFRWFQSIRSEAYFHVRAGPAGNASTNR